MRQFIYFKSLIIVLILFGSSAVHASVVRTEPIKPDSVHMTGETEKLDLSLTAYPVPAGDKVIITITNNGNDNKEKELTYSIGNVIGKKKRKGKVTMKSNGVQQIEIETGTWVKGVYFFIIEDGADIHVLKFLKG